MALSPQLQRREYVYTFNEIMLTLTKYIYENSIRILLHTRHRRVRTI